MSFLDKLKALLHEAGAEVKAGEEKLKAYVESAVKAHEDNKDLPTPTPAAATGSVPYMGPKPTAKNQRPLPSQVVNKDAGVTVESSPPPVSSAGHAIAADGTDLGSGQNLRSNAPTATGRVGDEGSPANAVNTKIIANQGNKQAPGTITSQQGTQAEDAYPGKSVQDLLNTYKADYDKLVAMAATLTQRETLRGESAFETTHALDPAFKASIEDLKSIVNDDPNKRLSSNFGHDVDELHQNMGSVLTYARDKQKRNNLTPNTPAELAQAALSGDYSNVRGLNVK